MWEETECRSSAQRFSVITWQKRGQLCLPSKIPRLVFRGCAGQSAVLKDQGLEEVATAGQHQEERLARWTASPFGEKSKLWQPVKLCWNSKRPANTSDGTSILTHRLSRQRLLVQLVSQRSEPRVLTCDHHQEQSRKTNTGETVGTMKTERIQVCLRFLLRGR